MNGDAAVLNAPDETFVDDAQLVLFENPPTWVDHWRGMPVFAQQNLMPWHTIKVHFRSREDRVDFAALLQQHVTEKTKFLWYPMNERQERTETTIDYEPPATDPDGVQSDFAEIDDGFRLT